MLDHRIVGATVVDGTMSPASTCDIGVRDGRIVYVGTDGVPLVAEAMANRTALVEGLRSAVHVSGHRGDGLVLINHLLPVGVLKSGEQPLGLGAVEGRQLDRVGAPW